MGGRDLNFFFSLRLYFRYTEIFGGSKTNIPKFFYTKTIYPLHRKKNFGGSGAPRPLKSYAHGLLCENLCLTWLLQLHYLVGFSLRGPNGDSQSEKICNGSTHKLIELRYYNCYMLVLYFLSVKQSRYQLNEF